MSEELSIQAAAEAMVERAGVLRDAAISVREIARKIEELSETATAYGVSINFYSNSKQGWDAVHVGPEEVEIVKEAAMQHLQMKLAKAHTDYENILKTMAE